MGRVFGISSARGNASSRSAVTTGYLVGSCTVSSPPSPWRRRLQAAAMRTRSRRSSCRHTAVSISSGRHASGRVGRSRFTSFTFTRRFLFIYFQKCPVPPSHRLRGGPTGRHGRGRAAVRHRGGGQSEPTRSGSQDAVRRGRPLRGNRWHRAPCSGPRLSIGIGVAAAAVGGCAHRSDAAADDVQRVAGACRSVQAVSGSPAVFAAHLLSLSPLTISLASPFTGGD